jgi:hypothetical protein
MDHPNTRLLARYALGDITDDTELQALEDHLMECDLCRRRAIAVDLIGSSPDGDTKVLLHVASEGGAAPAPLCGVDSAHVISRALLAGLDTTVLCESCLAALEEQGGGSSRRFVN